MGGFCSSHKRKPCDYKLLNFISQNLKQGSSDVNEFRVADKSLEVIMAMRNRVSDKQNKQVYSRATTMYAVKLK